MNNKEIPFIWLVGFLCCVDQLLFAELLVFKKNKTELSALSNTDIKKHGAVISQILQKYQWPMCTASDLTDNEKSELLESDRSYAEEQFIQKKLQETVKLSDGELQVVFIPTVLYELLGIYHFFAKPESRLRNVVKKWLWFDREHEGVTVDIEPFLNNSSSDVHYHVNKEYQSVNNRFFSNNELAVLELHQESSSVLLHKYPELKNASTALEASSIIQSKSVDIAQSVIQDLIALRDHMNFFPRRLDVPLNDKIQLMVHSLGDGENQRMVCDYLTHEYTARQKNKALIVRGSSPKEFDLEVAGVKAKHTLIGNSFSDYQCKDVDVNNDNLSKCVEIPLEQAYQENMVMPYSVSFGSSLFAGLLKDQTACAYHFLMGKRVYRDASTTIGNVAGYSLLIDKQKYVKDREQKLFFIPPLGTLPSLFGNGEFFHPRSTAAVVIKDNKPKRIRGLMWYELNDPSEIILIERDPLEHGAMFSEFVAQNSKIIHRDNSNSPEEAKKVRDKILASQKQVAQDYRKMIDAFAVKIGDSRKKDTKLMDRQ